MFSNCYHSNSGYHGYYFRCDDGHYDFSVTGCKQCDCSSIGGSNLCDADTGECRCKDNVEGEKCMTCKDNAFSLQVHSSVIIGDLFNDKIIR